MLVKPQGTVLNDNPGGVSAEEKARSAAQKGNVYE
jgi:hypothetical protein